MDVLDVMEDNHSGFDGMNVETEEEVNNYKEFQIDGDHFKLVSRNLYACIKCLCIISGKNRSDLERKLLDHFIASHFKCDHRKTINSVRYLKKHASEHPCSAAKEQLKKDTTALLVWVGRHKELIPQRVEKGQQYPCFDVGDPIAATMCDACNSMLLEEKRHLCGRRRIVPSSSKKVLVQKLHGQKWVWVRNIVALESLEGESERLMNMLLGAVSSHRSLEGVDVEEADAQVKIPRLYQDLGWFNGKCVIKRNDNMLDERLRKLMKVNSEQLARVEEDDEEDVEGDFVFNWFGEYSALFDNALETAEQAPSATRWWIVSNNGTKFGNFRTNISAKTIQRRRNFFMFLICISFYDEGDGANVGFDFSALREMIGLDITRRSNPLQTLKALFHFNQDPMLLTEEQSLIFIIKMAAFFNICDLNETRVQFDGSQASSSALMILCHDIIWMMRLFSLYGASESESVENAREIISWCWSEFNLYGTVESISSRCKKHMTKGDVGLFAMIIDCGEDWCIEGEIVKKGLVYRVRRQLLDELWNLRSVLMNGYDVRLQVAEMRDTLTSIRVESIPIWKSLMDTSILQRKMMKHLIGLHFYVENDSNELRIRKSEAVAWVRKYDQALSLMLILTHIDGGGVPRASEEALLSFCHNPNQPRSLFFTPEGAVSLMLTEKQQNALGRGGKVIPRFYTEELSLAMINVLVPLYKYYQRVCCMMANTDRSFGASPGGYIAVQKGRRMNAGWIRDMFVSKIVELEGVKIRYNGMRHLIHHIGTNIMSKQLELKLKMLYRSETELINVVSDQAEICLALGPIKRAFGLQFGHSTKVADLEYGRCSNYSFQNGASHVQLELSRAASTMWHSVIQNPFAIPSIGCTSNTLRATLNSFPSTWEVAAAQSGYKSDATLERKLFHFSGYREFKSEKQKLSVEAVLAGGDVISILPTGAGKTIIMAMAAYLMGGISVIVTPLVALRIQQVRTLNGLTASCNACSWLDMSADLKNSLLNPVDFNCGIRMILASPESCVSSTFINFIRSLGAIHRLGRVFVDEAHLINEWADFRPSYNSLQLFKKVVSATLQVVLLSATMPEAMVDSLSLKLGLQNPVRIRESSDRPNISYHISKQRTLDEVDDKLVELVHSALETGSVFIFCDSIPNAERVGSMLQPNCLIFHSQLSPFQKADVMKQVAETPKVLICGTTAISLGIDKSNVRLVVHRAASYSSIIGYQQEVGRAGRDGRPAVAHFLWCDNYMTPQPMDEKLLEFLGLQTCRRAYLTSYCDGSPTFCNQASDTLCDNCIENCNFGIEVSQMLSSMAVPRIVTPHPASLELQLSRQMIEDGCYCRVSRRTHLPGGTGCAFYGNCSRCGNPNHWAKNCSVKLQIKVVGRCYECWLLQDNCVCNQGGKFYLKKTMLGIFWKYTDIVQFCCPESSSIEDWFAYCWTEGGNDGLFNFWNVLKTLKDKDFQ